MPSIIGASQQVKSFPNQFVSPFGNDGVIPFYSSLPLKSSSEGCLDCVVCGNSLQRSDIISNAPNGFSFSEPKVVLTTLENREPPPSPPFTRNLVAYWPFYGDASDVTGNGNDLTIKGSIVYQPGILNQAVLFDGTGSSVVYNSNLRIDGDFTIAGWFYPISNLSPNACNGNPPDLPSVWATGLPGPQTSSCNWDISGFSLNSGFAYDCNFSPAANITVANNDNSICISKNGLVYNSWYCLVVTMQGSTVSVYLNGSLISSPSETSYSYFQGFVLGAYSIDPTYSGNAKICETGIWNRSWTSDEVTWFYNSGNGQPYSNFPYGP